MTSSKPRAPATGSWRPTWSSPASTSCRATKMCRQKLQAPDCRWDLVVCDEAHKMSATIFGGEIKYTKRYRLGQLLSTLTRHFLLMTATPHNGKEEDFQLFMALLDGDRFEGRFRDGVHVADVSDLMRRMVKESLLKFDGTPLFPRAHRLHGALQTLGQPKLSSTKQSPTTCATSSTAPMRWKTTSARARSASRSPSCSAGSPHPPKRSTNRCGVAESGWKAGCASSKCCNVADKRHLSWPQLFRCSTPRTSKTWRTLPTTKSRPPRRKFSTRRLQHAALPSCAQRSKR